MYRMSHYTEHLSPNTFEQGPIYPWYGTTYLNSATPLKCGLGAMWEMTGDPKEIGGNSFMHVRAGAGLAAGQLVSWATPTNYTVENPLTAATTTQAIKTTGTMVAGAEVGNFVYFVPTGGTPTIRRILSNTTTVITFSDKDYQIPTMPADADVASAVPVAGAATVTIIRPFKVIVNTAATVPVGVALGTTTDTYYTIIQVGGLALVQGVGNGTGLVVGEPAVGSAAGVAIGMAADITTTASPAKFNGAASMVPLQASTAAGPLLLPFYVNFLGNI